MGKLYNLGFYKPESGSGYRANLMRDYGNGFIQFITITPEHRNANGVLMAATYQLTTCLAAAWDATLWADDMGGVVDALLDPDADEFTIAYCRNLSPQNLIDLNEGMRQLEAALAAARGLPADHYAP